MSETPLTVDSLVDEVLDSVRGYSRQQDLRTTLTTGISAVATSMAVNDASQVSKGYVEVEDELIQVASVDATNGVVTFEPWGRGQSGTTAAIHAAGVRVTGAPLYPRQRVRNAIYGTLREMFPQIYAATETLINGSATVINYTMPVGCYHVLRVENLRFGPSGSWEPVRRWRQNKLGSTVELEVLSPVTVGSNRVRVVYMRTPPDSIGDTDDLTTYGYDYQIRDVVVLGAAAKLLAYTEAARVQTDSMVGHGRDEVVQNGSATAASKMLYALFQKRLTDEAAQLMMRHPIQMHLLR